jgi:hypothetical protein
LDGACAPYPAIRRAVCEQEGSTQSGPTATRWIRLVSRAIAHQTSAPFSPVIALLVRNGAELLDLYTVSAGPPGSGIGAEQSSSEI